jgi:hypothetical protein
MFAFLSIVLATLFLLFTLAMPFLRPAWAQEVLRRAENFFIHRPGGAVFFKNRTTGSRSLAWMRAWGIGAGLFFISFCILTSPHFRDHPLSILGTCLGVLLATAASVTVLVTWSSHKAFLSRSRGSAALKRSGYQSAWTITPARAPRGLGEELSAYFKRSSFLGIVDATGHGLLGKGNGPLGGMVYDMIATTTDVPVSVLLMCPEASAIDPESLQVTVYQTVLYEMGLPHQAFQRRVQGTLQAIDELNDKRPDGAKINVRFYNENPPFRALIFDHAAFVAPWNPNEAEALFSLFSAQGEDGERTLFDVFYQQSLRLWAHSLPIGAAPATQAAPTGSRVIRRRKAAPRTKVDLPAAADPSITVEQPHAVAAR